MKIVVYSDLHGNKYALEELQKTKDYKNAYLRIFLGDAVAMCPYSNECLKGIWGSGDIFLLGNHDGYCAYGLPKEENFKLDKIAHQDYIRNKTQLEYREKLKSMPKDYYLNCNDKKFYFTHYGWRSDRLAKIDPDEPDAPTVKTAEIFKDIDADYIIFGHNHKPAEFKVGEKNLLCVGSLGMKYPGNYAIININDDEVKIERKKIFYDVGRLKREILEANYPLPRIPTYYSNWFDQ